MLKEYYTEKLVGLQGVTVKKITEAEEKIEIAVEMKRQMQECPQCGQKTDRIHDYRNQKIRDMSCFGRTVTLLLRKRRYVCECGKRFYEKNSWLERYQRETKRTTLAILKDCGTEANYATIGKRYGVSGATAARRFDRLQMAAPKILPEVLGIDEFRGNSGGEKFHCILTDIQNRHVADILQTRLERDLIDYFKKYDRSTVKYFVSDMYKPYAEIAKTYFPGAIHVIDRYHWVRQATWAFEKVRKDIQKKFSKSHRIYFKHSRKLLLKRASKLSEQELQQINIMLYASADLSNAYFLKEQLYRILDGIKDHTVTDKSDLKREFRVWIRDALDSEIPAFVSCAHTYRRWLEPILNSFDCSYSNGFTEGCNNRVKVLKRNAFGFHSFKRFRSRILFSCPKQ